MKSATVDGVLGIVARLRCGLSVKSAAIDAAGFTANPVTMTPLEKCLQSLSVIIGRDAQATGMQLAEKAIDDYLAAQPDKASLEELERAIDRFPLNETRQLVRSYLVHCAQRDLNPRKRDA